MKINLHHNINKYKGKIISVILKISNEQITCNNTQLVVGVFRYNEAGRYIIGYTDISFLNKHIIAIFDNIEEAYAYYEYLIADGGSNGN